MAVSKRTRNNVLRRVIEIKGENPGKVLKPNDERLTSLNYENLEDILEVLEAQGLVVVEYYADNSVVRIGLTDKGRAYFENTSDEKWRFVRQFVFVPGLVSFLTTGLIMLIKFFITGSWL